MWWSATCTLALLGISWIGNLLKRRPPGSSSLEHTLASAIWSTHGLRSIIFSMSHKDTYHAFRRGYGCAQTTFDGSPWIPMTNLWRRIFEGSPCLEPSTFLAFSISSHSRVMLVTLKTNQYSTLKRIYAIQGPVSRSIYLCHWAVYATQLFLAGVSPFWWLTGLQATPMY